MPRRNPRLAPNAENASSEQTEATATETIADRARQMAERIGRLPDDVVASFALTDSCERVRRLQQIEAKLSLGMFPLISWLERRRPADKAELVKRRLFPLLQEAVQCAQLEIPEYAGGVITGIAERAPSDGACRTAAMMTTAKLFAATLRAWADDIEAEDGQRRLPQAEPPAASPATEAATTLQALESLGDRNYRIGKQTKVIEESEDAVLQVFFKDARREPMWISQNQNDLKNQSGYEHAPRILKKMQTKYPLMAQVIDCPGKRGHGGLKVYLMKPIKNQAKSS